MRERLSLLAAAFVCAAFFLLPAIPALAADSDYQYDTLSGTTVEITAYTGTENEIEIPASIDGYTVVSIGDMAFASNSAVTSVIIPGSVTNIGYGAFYYCTQLASVTFCGTVDFIDSYAFTSCTSLSDIELPVGLAEISSYTFSGCKALSSVALPDGLESINEYAFKNCWALESVTFPSTLQSVGASAFYCCYAISDVTVPAALQTVGSSAFSNCSALSALYYESGAADFANIEISSGNSFFTGAEITYNYSYSTHSYVVKTTNAPGCTASGSIVYECKYCSATYTESLAPTGHSYDSG
ncbi:MAG: leucine-rich repeat domain-containing protein, partial [Clostridiales bacterium]|nr:leucine-rich repeat domain-containing protein [Clostridiales bacterium]